MPAPPQPEPKQSKARRTTPKTKLSAPSELEQLEAAISDRETAVAELERRLAEDWTDTEMLAAHRQARDELRALLNRWETMFERAQS